MTLKGGVILRHTSDGGRQGGTARSHQRDHRFSGFGQPYLFFGGGARGGGGLLATGGLRDTPSLILEICPALLGGGFCSFAMDCSSGFIVPKRSGTHCPHPPPSVYKSSSPHLPITQPLKQARFLISEMRLGWVGFSHKRIETSLRAFTHPSLIVGVATIQPSVLCEPADAVGG